MPTKVTGRNTAKNPGKKTAKKPVAKMAKTTSTVKAKVAKKTMAPTVKAVPKAKVTQPKKQTPPPGKTSFMWKLLERKQEQLKANGGQASHPFAHTESTYTPPGTAPQDGHARFNGPRRKAA